MNKLGCDVIGSKSTMASCKKFVVIANQIDEDPEVDTISFYVQ